MIARYNRLSFAYGVPGIAMQIAGCFMSGLGQGDVGLFGVVFLMFGILSLMIGLAYYAKAKGQSWAWCAAAFLSILGLLLLLLLEDKSQASRRPGEEHEKA
jgi:apolipoprotein N-acyltransferase